MFVLSGCFQKENLGDPTPFAKFYKNGKPKIVGFQNKKTGKATGKWKFYDEKGQLRETGFFKKGKEHGEWIRFNEKGEVISTSYYSNGKNFRTVIPWD